MGGGGRRISLNPSQLELRSEILFHKTNISNNKHSQVTRHRCWPHLICHSKSATEPEELLSPNSQLLLLQLAQEKEQLENRCCPPGSHPKPHVTPSQGEAESSHQALSKSQAPNLTIRVIMMMTGVWSLYESSLRWAV